MHRFLLALLASIALDGCSGCSNDKKATQCDAGLACATNPGAPCRAGAIACNPSPVCADGAPLLAGVSCGTGNVCNGAGTCLACASGTACDAGECTSGSAIDCS